MLTSTMRLGPEVGAAAKLPGVQRAAQPEARARAQPVRGRGYRRPRHAVQGGVEPCAPRISGQRAV